MMNIAILGGGESGVGAAILAKKLGHNVWLSDSGTVKKTYLDQLTNLDISFESGGHSEDKILSAELIIKSPGIPDTAPIVQSAKINGIPVISEIEWAWRNTQAKCIAITGSNGKTTTTALIGHMLKTAGLDVKICGNIGQSMAAAVAEGDPEWLVIEVSSFQLDGITSFAPHIAIILNITPDHLDRYHYDFDEYIRSKFLITKYQGAGDYLIYNLDDEATSHWLPILGTAAKQVPFTHHTTVQMGAYVFEESKLKIKMNQEELNINPEDIELLGKHNRYNTMAAGIVGRILELRKDVIRESLKSFHTIPHRLENVATIKGITFINDSKATNVNSVWYALESLKQNIVWIAGGIDKGNDYEPLKPLVREKVKGLVLLGKENGRLKDAFAGDLRKISDAMTMQQAVQNAFKMACEGDVILLSPACSSFDLFKNYEDRGDQFKSAVKGLA